MAEVLVLALKVDGNPVNKLARDLGWDIQFSGHDIEDLQLFVTMMSPLVKMFTELNSETASTIHRLFPTIKVLNAPNISLLLVRLKLLIIQEIYSSLKPALTNKHHPAHHFSVKLFAQLKEYFSYIYYPQDPEFSPVFLATCFLSPAHKFLVTEDLMTHVKPYLKSKFIVSRFNP